MKVVQYHDIHPSITVLTGLPFSIMDKNNVMLGELYEDLNRFHHSSANRTAVLNAVSNLYNIQCNNRIATARQYERTLDDVELTHILGGQVTCPAGITTQTLESFIEVKINDSRVKFRQLPLTFIVAKDNTWDQIVPNVAPTAKEAKTKRVVTYAPKTSAPVSPKLVKK